MILPASQLESQQEKNCEKQRRRVCCFVVEKAQIGIPISLCDKEVGGAGEFTAVVILSDMKT